MASLNGARVALLEARMSNELASLVERAGGTPYTVPAVREVPLTHPPEASAFIEQLCARRFDYVVLMTGVGVTALLREAERDGRLDEVLAALRNTTTVCRGPKPAAVLKRHDVPVRVSAPEPHTATELLAALLPMAVAGKRIGLLHYGERNDAVGDALKARNADVEDLCLYEWQLPDEVGGLERLVDDLVGARVDAIAFTSQIQVRHLFAIAERRGRVPALVEALNRQVIVAAVGPVCASALRSVGVIPHVQPAHPKMGPMVLALADYLELTGR